MNIYHLRANFLRDTTEALLLGNCYIFKKYEQSKDPSIDNVWREAARVTINEAIIEFTSSYPYLSIPTIIKLKKIQALYYQEECPITMIDQYCEDKVKEDILKLITGCCVIKKYYLDDIVTRAFDHKGINEVYRVSGDDNTMKRVFEFCKPTSESPFVQTYTTNKGTSITFA